MAYLNTESCPKCGCWMAETFKCGCGGCKGSFCKNCGRYTAPTLRRDEYAEPDPAIGSFAGTVMCSVGPHEHEHPLIEG